MLSGWPRGIAEPSGPEQCLRRSQREALVGVQGTLPRKVLPARNPSLWSGRKWRDGDKGPRVLSDEYVLVCTAVPLLAPSGEVSLWLVGIARI